MVELEHISDDEIWDLLVADSHTLALDGHRVDFRRYLTGVPGIQQRPGALQAAIAATFENAAMFGEERSVAADRLRREFPSLVDEVDGVELVAELIEGVDAAEPHTLSEPRVLPCHYGLPWKDGAPRYQLIETIARGTRGTVYRGKDRALSNPDKPADVAVKVIASWTGMAFGDVLAEAIRAKQINHPNVARVLDVGEANPSECFIVFEFVDGVTLERYLDQAPTRPDNRVSVELLLPALEGLAAAHDNGLAHLDIHPKNVLINRSGQPSLIDFGLGVAAYEAWRPAERPLGSLGFMAPETYARSHGASPLRCDVYCATGLLFWCITGVIPNGQSIEEIETRLLDKSARLPGQDAAHYIGDVDRDLAAILARGLARDFDERYPSARALTADLHAWLEHQPIEWRRPSVCRRARLLTRRSPLTALAFTCAVAALALGSAGAAFQYTSHKNALRIESAERRAAEAEFAQEVAEADAKLARGMKDLTSAFSGFLRSRSGTSVGRGWVVMLTLTHNLVDQGLQLDESVLAKTQAERIDLAREYLDAAEQTSGADSIEAMLWHGALASWLFDAERYADAREELSACRRRWARSIAANDPMVARLRMLEDAAIALDISQAEPARASAAERALTHRYASELPSDVRAALIDFD